MLSRTSDCRPCPSVNHSPFKPLHGRAAGHNRASRSDNSLYLVDGRSAEAEYRAIPTVRMQGATMISGANPGGRAFCAAAGI
jgi:hypothetical protein